MRGGVKPFRGTGSDARRYVESDRSTADDYYLGDGGTFAAWTLSDAHGDVTASAVLDADRYAGWVDWAHPVTGERMGVPRAAGDGRKGSPRFQEMIVNAPKSLSIAAALHPDVSAALDAAQADAADEIRRYLALHATTRIGPRGAQEVVPVEQLQTVSILHHTSRAGDPHRHVHFQIGTRVWAAGAWRGLDGVALFKMQGAIRAIGTAVIAAHPQLAAVLDGHGLTLDPATGEVVELEPFNQVMSKRGAQVEANLQRLAREWEASHPGETMSRTTSGRLQASAWAQDRPSKKPTTLAGEAAWVVELRDAGYDESALRRGVPVRAVSLDALDARAIANRALDRCAAGASAWTPHTIREHVAALLTETGVRATPGQLRQFTDQAAGLARADCLSVLPLGAPAPEHVACLTSLDVIAAETSLRDLLAGLAADGDVPLVDIRAVATARGLDDGQARAAAVASADRLVVVEGAAGSGKTSMLGVALAALQVAPAATGETGTGGGSDGRGRAGVARVLAPTRRAAQVAQEELGVPATSVAALVHAHGWRWNNDGVWTRLNIGDTDPDTGRAYAGPPAWARLAPGERVIVDEAGMLDQDTAIALLTTVTEAEAAVALVGDRAQLPAIGRGGVLGMAASARGLTFDMAEVHRFAGPGYAALTLAMRGRDDPGGVFDQLAALGLVRLHASDDAMREHVAAGRRDGEAVTVATNQEAAEFNGRIRARRVAARLVDDTATVTGNDGLSIGAGDLIQTRRNDNHLGVANRQTWTVQQVQDSAVWAREAGAARGTPRLARLPVEYVNDHAHLAYAATAYGVQGATVPASHTILADAISAAGLYVGMTRGRAANLLHVVAENLADARAQFIEAMGRDRADRGLATAAQAAGEAVAGLVSDGPVKLVASELARLDQAAAQAERRAGRWEQTANRLDAQRAVHQAEDGQAAVALHDAEEQAAWVRAEVAGPLAAQAEADGTAFLAAVAAEAAASAKLATASRLGQRRARADHQNATARTQDMRQRLRATWGEPPRDAGTLATWAADQANKQAGNDLRVTAAARTVQAARTTKKATEARHERELLALLTGEYSPHQVRRDPVRARLTNPHDQARQARSQAAAAREQAAKLRSLPPDQATAIIKSQRAAAEQAAQAAAERAQRLRRQREPIASVNDTSRNRPTLGL
ncbi:MAG: relaxase domain-containing protein [Bifidobacteriaceae bacterium]|jgi:hypothetical protein|nr:relaxase domain-containing protein [Bifidobacteriaceae bacterium]